MSTFPEWLRHDNHDVDRLMVACWLRRQGEHDAAMLVIRNVIGPHREHDAEPTLAEIVELLGEWDDCHENPRQYAYVADGLELHGDTDGWSVTRCEAIAADATMLAEQIVASVRPLTLVGAR